MLREEVLPLHSLHIHIVYIVLLFASILGTLSKAKNETVQRLPLLLERLD
jgi:hypothetical protein